MKILFLSDNFPPEVNAPASRTYEHCRYWARLGHEVTVLTCAPNFPKGRVFPGYKNRFWHSETVDGVRVVRVWSYITANQGFLRRTLDYLSYMLSAIVATPFLPRPDVVIATSPQFFAACAGYVISRLRRVPFVFELRDLWPESIKAVGVMKQSLLVRMLERIELFLYRKASGIVSVTSSFRTRLGERGIDTSKIQVVTNGVDLSRFGPRPKDRELSKALGLDGKFVVGYVGTLGLAHGLETVLEAAEAVARAPDGDRFRFVFLGDGASKQKLVTTARDRGLDNVLFLDTVAKDQVARYWSLLDASVIHLRKNELFEGVIPSKLFECMGMGIPVLHGVPGESAAIVATEGVGLVFESGEAGQLAAAIQRIGSDAQLREALRAACVRAAPKYEREQLAQKMLGFIAGLVQLVEGPSRQEPASNELMLADVADSER
ncbi:MAG TPA: glycosyltransferase family 4 protein [Polyangiaceae bacterium]|nr:glycosyltransferase family 4 protein [Polyangiaceae bacterium]